MDARLAVAVGPAAAVLGHLGRTEEALDQERRACQALEKLGPEPDPRAIVVLTDGVDNKSRRSLDTVVAEAYRAGRIGKIAMDVGRGSDQRPSARLAEMEGETGTDDDEDP